MKKSREASLVRADGVVWSRNFLTTPPRPSATPPPAEEGSSLKQRIRDTPLKHFSGKRLLRRNEVVELKQPLQIVVDKNDIVIRVDGVNQTVSPRYINVRRGLPAPEDFLNFCSDPIFSLENLVIHVFGEPTGHSVVTGFL